MVGKTKVRLKKAEQEITTMDVGYIDGYILHPGFGSLMAVVIFGEKITIFFLSSLEVVVEK